MSTYGYSPTRGQIITYRLWSLKNKNLQHEDFNFSQLRTFKAFDSNINENIKQKLAIFLVFKCFPQNIRTSKAFILFLKNILVDIMFLKRLWPKVHVLIIIKRVGIMMLIKNECLLLRIWAKKAEYLSKTTLNWGSAEKTEPIGHFSKLAAPTARVLLDILA